MKNALKTIARLILGILTIPLMFGLVTSFQRNVLPIYASNSLEWYYIIMFLPAFIIAGIINRKTKLIFLPFLFIPVLLLIYLKSYSSTMLMVILFCIVGLLITRKEINRKIRLSLSIFLVLGFSYYLFSRPLILKKENFAITPNNDLINVEVVWDFFDDLKKIKKIPDQSFLDRNGKEVTLNNFKGKNIYITFWATYCGACILEKPLLEEYKTKYTKPDLVFIDISLDYDKDKWKSYIEEHNPQGIQLIAKQKDNTQANFYFSTMPSAFIVDTTGTCKEWQRPSLIKLLTEGGKVNLLEHTEHITEYVNSPMRIFEDRKDENGKTYPKRVR